MTADTCIQYVMPATERGYNIKGQMLYERAVNIICDADGDYYRSYKEFPSKDESVIVNPKEAGK